MPNFYSPPEHLPNGDIIIINHHLTHEREVSAVAHPLGYGHSVGGYFLIFEREFTRARIDLIFVPPQHRDKKIGRALFEDLILTALRHPEVQEIQGQVTDKTGKIVKLFSEFGGVPTGNNNFTIALTEKAKRNHLQQRLKGNTENRRYRNPLSPFLQQIYTAS